MIQSFADEKGCWRRSLGWSRSRVCVLPQSLCSYIFSCIIKMLGRLLFFIFFRKITFCLEASDMQHLGSKSKLGLCWDDSTVRAIPMLESC